MLTIFASRLLTRRILARAAAYLACACLWLGTAGAGRAQAQTPEQPPAEAVLAPAGEDSIPRFALPPIDIWAAGPTRAEERRARRAMSEADRLRYNIYKVYPLARQAAAIIKQVDAEMARMGKRRDEKAYLRRLEKELFKRYESQLKKLSVRQGRLLIKLIDRETGNRAYYLIKDYKSGATAVLWQLVAKLFGSDLKDGYDPTVEADIERIVRQIETGQDPVYNAMHYAPSLR